MAYQPNQQQFQKGNLQTIFNHNFSGYNALGISLVKDNDPNKKSYANEFFMFISITPGVKTDQNASGRTYDNSNKITMKVNPEQMLGLANAIEMLSNGYSQIVGNFVIFTDSSKSQFSDNQNNSQKSLRIQEGQDQKGERKVSILFINGQNKQTFSESPMMFKAIGQIIKFVAEKCLELEFSYKEKSVMFQQQQPVNRPMVTSEPVQTFVPPTPMGNAPPFNSMPPMGNMDNSNIVQNFQSGLNAASDMVQEPNKPNHIF